MFFTTYKKDPVFVNLDAFRPLDRFENVWPFCVIDFGPFLRIEFIYILGIIHVIEGDWLENYHGVLGVNVWDVFVVKFPRD